MACPDTGGRYGNCSDGMVFGASSWRERVRSCEYVAITEGWLNPLLTVG